MELEKETIREINALCNSVIMVADKFIGKCKDGRARSVETLFDMKIIKRDAIILKEKINEPDLTNQ